MRSRSVFFLALAIALSVSAPPGASAQVVVSRQGDENPAISITKSIFWGGLGGLILGSAIALVAEEDEGEIIKWSFVGGTFAGLAVGIWHVTNRPEPRGALLEWAPDGLRVAAPAVRFEARPDPLLAGEETDRTMRVALFSLAR
ncbi:MAG: hypothetical protein EHM19_05590 [Candidatus Latescibacterota bacterium]|nr:MAG: hypothetical protein EHM19_05590 [Candidatus Latescibacterota bacterium]